MKTLDHANKPNKTKDNKMKWILLGEAGVDSGALMISDPCYADMVSKWLNGDGMFDDNQINYPSYRDGDGYLHWDSNYSPRPGLGVQARTAYGDGTYKVYGLCSDGDTTRAHAMLVITGDEELPQFPKGGAA